MHTFNAIQHSLNTFNLEGKHFKPFAGFSVVLIGGVEQHYGL